MDQHPASVIPVSTPAAPPQVYAPPTSKSPCTPLAMTHHHPAPTQHHPPHQADGVPHLLVVCLQLQPFFAVTGREYGILRGSYFLTQQELSLRGPSSQGQQAEESKGQDPGTARTGSRHSWDRIQTHLGQDPGTAGGQPGTRAQDVAAGHAEMTTGYAGHMSSGRNGVANASRQLSFAELAVSRMERDYSHVVGLGFPIYLLIMLFVLVSGWIGWSAWLFTIIAGACLCAINTKLLSVIACITRRGLPRSLHNTNLFWLGEPRLLLPAIKLMLFFCGFVYSNAFFFGTQFGAHSCFFSQTGFQDFLPVPFWAVMVANTITLLSLSLVTLPLYALAVLMAPPQANHVPRVLRWLLPYDVNKSREHHSQGDLA
ncbi:MAG: hypothetical protein WDW38_009112 [Sanguina aurantia]